MYGWINNWKNFEEENAQITQGKRDGHNKTKGEVERNYLGR
jgi:hypothetical protein